MLSKKNLKKIFFGKIRIEIRAQIRVQIRRDFHIMGLNASKGKMHYKNFFSSINFFSDAISQQLINAPSPYLHQLKTYV